MNKELKQALKESFKAPAPTQKRGFLHSIQSPPIGNFEFIITQAAYIRKWVWIFSVLVLAVAFVGAELLEQNMVWCISAFMPLLAMAVITETGRSEVYGMAEFEISTRFSLRSVVLARLCILGLANFILICLLVPLVFINSGVTFFQTSVYILCPYLLTAFICLWIVRKVHSKDSVYLCAGISACVSVGYILLYTKYFLYITEQNFIWWIVALLVMGIGTLNQIYYMVKQTEELIWS